MLTHIAAATDGSARAGRAVRFAAQLAESFGADLTLICVREEGSTAPLDGVRAQAIETSANLEVVEAELPAEAIVEVAHEIGADAIVIGNLGMSDRRQFLLGNIPNRVSHQANCTVIIFDTRDEKDRKKKR